MTPACFCHHELQRLYDEQYTTLATLRAHLGFSSWLMDKCFRALKIRRHKRGGDYGGQANRIENRINGDAAVRARAAARSICREGRTDKAGAKLLCVMTRDGKCGGCTRGAEQGTRMLAGIVGGSMSGGMGW